MSVLYIYVCVCIYLYILDFPGGSDGKKHLPTMRETRVQSLSQEDSPGEGNGSPLQYSCLENHMDGWRSLVGYSPWGHKESDTTEQLNFHFSRLMESWECSGIRMLSFFLDLG